MGSAVGIALLMAGAITTFHQDSAPLPLWLPDTSGVQQAAYTEPGGRPIRTTVEEQGSIKLKSTSAVQSEWTLGCVAILTAPKTMQVNDIASVETTLLVAAGQEEIASLLQAAKDTQTAINGGSPAASADPKTGLDAPSQDALQHMIDGNKNRQAAIDTLRGAPIMTVHLAGPGFDITVVTPERQGIKGTQPGQWQWKIKAVDPGPRTLTVSYSAEVEISGQRVPQALRTLSRDVTVNVTSTGFLTKVGEFIKPVKSIVDSISGFWTTLILPALMFLYGLRKWFRERRAKALQPTSAG
jgi:hypothetical protein